MGNNLAVASSGSSSLLNVFFAPETIRQLPIYYLFWIILYLTINIIWDIRSTRTPKFHFGHLGSKVGALYNAAAFASSLLLFVSLLDDATRKLAGDTVAPIVLAALSGLLVALAELCPYKVDREVLPAT